MAKWDVGSRPSDSSWRLCGVVPSDADQEPQAYVDRALSSASVSVAAGTANVIGRPSALSASQFSSCPPASSSQKDYFSEMDIAFPSSQLVDGIRRTMSGSSGQWRRRHNQNLSLMRAVRNGLELPSLAPAPALENPAVTTCGTGASDVFFRSPGAPAPARQFLDLLQALLTKHEVKLALQLLEHTSSSQCGCRLPHELRSFVADQRRKRWTATVHGVAKNAGDDGLSLIEATAAQCLLEGVGSEDQRCQSGGVAAGTPGKAAVGIPSASLAAAADSVEPPTPPSKHWTNEEVPPPLSLPCSMQEAASRAQTELIDSNEITFDPMAGAYGTVAARPPTLSSPLEVETPRIAAVDAHPSFNATPQRRACAREPVAAALSLSPIRQLQRRIKEALPKPEPGSEGAGIGTISAIPSLVPMSSLDEEGLRERMEIADFDDLSEEQIAWLARPCDRWILHPNQLSSLVWQFLALLAIMAECVVLPLDLAFNISLPEKWYLLFTAFFVMDIVLNFNTGYFRASLLIMHRKLLTKHYLRSWFLIDLISTVPWEFLFRSIDPGDKTAKALYAIRLGSMMRALRLLRLTKLVSKVRRLQAAYFSSLRRYQLRILLMKMLITTGMLCHWAACLWGVLGDPDVLDHFSASDLPHEMQVCTMGGPCENGVEGSPWRRRYGLDNFSPATQYAVSIEFATALIVGGDMPVLPGTVPERIYTTVMMIIGVFTCSIIVGEVLLVLTRQREQTLSFDEKVGKVHDFMSLRQVPLELQAKIRRYLEHTFKVQYNLAQDDREFMDGLSPWLRVELLEHLHRGVLTQHKFFKALPAQAIRHICLEAQPVVYAPGDLVTEKGHIAQTAFFVVHGKLRVAHAVGLKSVYLTPPSWLGDRCLFIDSIRSHTVSAVVHTETLCVRKACVLELCEEFPEMKETYQWFQSAILTGDESGMRCAVCNGLGHAEDDCPDVNHHDDLGECSGNARIRPKASSWPGQTRQLNVTVNDVRSQLSSPVRMAQLAIQRVRRAQGVDEPTPSTETDSEMQTLSP